MGFYDNSWVFDMLDKSCGCGSINLAMNSGMAQVQASAYMNCCWGTGSCFFPYQLLGNGMNILLSTDYAIWQAKTGNNSNSGIYCGGSGYIGDAFYRSTTPSNDGGNNTTPNTQEQTYKTDFNSLKGKMNDFANYLIKDERTKDAGEGIKSYIRDLEKNKDLTWEDRFKQLKDYYNDIMKDSGHKSYYKKYLEENKTIKFKLNEKVGKSNDLPTLEALISMTGIGEKTFSVKGGSETIDADYIHDQMDQMDNSNCNTRDYLHSITERNVLQFLSDYNSKYSSETFVALFLKKYGKLGDNEKKEALDGLKSVKNELIERAEGIKYVMKNPDKMTEAIKALNAHFDGGFTEAGLERDFNYLYALVRMTEVEALNKEIDSRLKGDLLDDGNKPSQILGLKEATEEELEKELPSMTLPSDEDIECTEIPTLKPLGGNAGPVSKTQAEVQKKFEQEPLYKSCYEKVGSAGDKTVYKWINLGAFPDNDNIKPGTLFVVDASDGKLRLLENDEIGEYGITKKADSVLEQDGISVYAWPIDEVYKDENGIEIKKDVLFVIEDGKPVAFQ